MSKEVVAGSTVQRNDIEVLPKELPIMSDGDNYGTKRTKETEKKDDMIYCYGNLWEGPFDI